MQADHMIAPTLVVGGTGKTGRRIASRLARRGLHPRVGSRSGTPPFGWSERTTWGPALDGVGSVYIAYHPDLAIPGAVETVASFAELAVRRDVPRLVLLAARGEPAAEEAEHAVRASGAELTVLRSAWFMQNFSEDFLLPPVLSGGVALPAGVQTEPFVDAEDLADVAVAALTDDRHIGETYELTGPQLLTFAGAVAAIAEATSSAIRYVPVPFDEYADAAAGQGVPPEVVELLGMLFGELLDGRNAHVADGVERALGRPPGRFGEYARRTAAEGAWSAPALPR